MKFTTTEVGESWPLSSCVCGADHKMHKRSKRHGKQGWACPDHHAAYNAAYRSEEKVRVYNATYYATSKEAKLTNLIENDPLTQDCVYSYLNPLVKKLAKIVALITEGSDGEQQAARQAYWRLRERLSEAVHNKPGGKEWLQRQITSAEMQNTRRETTSPLALASSLGE